MQSLPAGKNLGPYRIVARIGEGGMGEVYRARDTRLDRIVAIKVLSARLADQPAARERFEREARAISGLSHPHICTLFDIGHHEGVDYLVMEYLEGETLSERLNKGALSIQLTLKYAAEIADALDKAHRLGVVHRDLKPANVILTKSGTKLLDFGLAKLQTKAGLVADRSANPTKGTDLTESGAILGTLQYMSPEQLEGKDTDARSDIFSFGSLVYEMATGRKAFQGDSQASLIGAILHLEPPALSSFEGLAPPLFDHVVKKCLAKNPSDRWQTARDLADQLTWMSLGESQHRVTTAPRPRSSKAKALVWPIVSGVLALTLGAISVAYFTRDIPADRSEIRFQLAPPEDTIFSPAPADLSVSPDGSHVVFAALDSNGDQLLWLRSLDTMSARPLPGAEDAFSPFWSPDSRHIAFFASGKLQKVDAFGSTPETICDAPDGRGGAWNRDNVIVFARNLAGPLYRVSAAGGSASPLTTLDQSKRETGHIWPEFLPDGRHFLYLAWSPQKESRQIYAASLDGGPEKSIFPAESNAGFASSGHVIFVSGGKLLAQQFNPEKLEVSGEPFLVSDDVWSNPATGRASFGVSKNGVVVYRNGVINTTEFVRRDRAGKILGRAGTPDVYSNPSLSPDGKRLAMDLRDFQKGIRNIWTLELDRSGATSRFTFTPSLDSSPIWLPNGKQIIFVTDRDTPGKALSVYRTEFGGSARDEVVLKSDALRELLDWSPSEQAIVFETFTPKTRNDIWLARLTGNSTPAPFLQTDFAETHAQVSPNGQWIAYSSDESGQYEVYVQRFPTPGGKRLISTDGGMQPRWSPKGDELFYLAPDRTLVAVAVNAGSAFEVGASEPLFQSLVYGPSVVRSRNNYVVGADGKSFIINSVVDSGRPVNVIVGWKR